MGAILVGSEGMVKLKPLWTLLKLLLLVVLLVAIFAAVWLRQGPKSLNWAKPTLLSYVNSGNTPYTIDIADAAIDWRSLAKFGLVRLQHVTFTGRDGTVFASLPEIYVSLDIIGFLPHRRMLNTIYLPHPKLYLTRDKDKNLRLGLSDEASAPLATIEREHEAARKSSGGKLPFRNLRVDAPTIVILDEITGKRLSSTNGSIRLQRLFGHYDGQIDLPFTYGEAKGSIRGVVDSVRRDEHILTLTLTGVPTDYTCIFAHCPGGLDLSGIIGGEVSLAFDDQTVLHGFDADIRMETLRVEAPEWFPEPLEMKASSIEVRADNDLRSLAVTKLELDTADAYITGNATAEKKADGWYATGHGAVDKLDIRKLYKYWPITLAPDSRTWVTTSLKEGYGENGTLDFKITPQDISAPDLSDGAIDATVHATDMTVHYIEGFPEVKQVNGIVKFTGTTIDVAAESGTMLTGSSISNSRIFFPDLTKPATPMQIDLNLKASASDAATFLKLEHFTFDDSLALNPATIKGTAEGSIKLAFDAFSEENDAAEGDGSVNFDGVGYDIALQLSQVSQPKFAGKFDLANASGALKASNAGMSFDGNTKLGPANGVNVKVTQKSGEDVHLALDGKLARADFAALGLPDDPRFGEGSLHLLADAMVTKDDLLLEKGSIDLTDMAFSIPEISWQKRRGAPASIALKPKEKDFLLDIKAPGLSVPNATLSLTPELGVASLVLPRVKTENSDFSLRYRTIAGGFEASLTGNTLDASMSYMGEGAGGENHLLADFPAMKLTLDLGALILVPEHPFSQVKGTINCTAARCESANIKAQTGNADVAASITREQGMRQFLLTSSNAGDFLRAVDITDRMFGGTLRLKGTYDDSVSPPALPAQLDIRSFTLRNSQILGRILSIGSLTGLANALTGSGIAFEKLTGDIHSQGGIIRISDGKASGNAIGVGIGGTVDTVKSTLNLRGTLVPAAALNTIFSSIPLLGTIAGGDTGLIAFNFSVKGPQSDPSVMVNPFSGLTPGFLRGIWGSNNPDDADSSAGNSSADNGNANRSRRHERGVGF